MFYLTDMKGVSTGTTTVGIVCKDGIVLAAEKKATMGYLVATKDDIKIVEIMPHIAMTQAGMVGDVQALTRYLIAESKLYELRTRKRIPVKVAASLLSNILYGGRWSYLPYQVQLILAGFDETGPNLFILHPDGSSLEEKRYFSTGSGSPMAFGVLETLFKEGFSIDECKKVAARAVRAAVERDIASGGRGIDIAVIDKDGFKLLKEAEVEKVIERTKK